MINARPLALDGRVFFCPKSLFYFSLLNEVRTKRHNDICYKHIYLVLYTLHALKYVYILSRRLYSLLLYVQLVIAVSLQDTAMNLHDTSGMPDSPRELASSSTAEPDLTIMRGIASRIKDVVTSWRSTGDPCVDMTWVGVSCIWVTTGSAIQVGYVSQINLPSSKLNSELRVFDSLSSTYAIRITCTRYNIYIFTCT